MEGKFIADPMRITYMPGGIGAVAYNAIVAQRPGEDNTIVAFSGGSLLNLAQGKFGRYNENDVRWLAADRRRLRRHRRRRKLAVQVAEGRASPPSRPTRPRSCSAPAAPSAARTG